MPKNPHPDLISREDLSALLKRPAMKKLFFMYLDRYSHELIEEVVVKLDNGDYADTNDYAHMRWESEAEFVLALIRRFASGMMPLVEDPEKLLKAWDEMAEDPRNHEEELFYEIIITSPLRRLGQKCSWEEFAVVIAENSHNESFFTQPNEIRLSD